MIDSGATALFIHDRFVRQNNILRQPLNREITLYNIDGTKNTAGTITHFVRLTLKVGEHSEKPSFSSLMSDPKT